MGDSMVVIMWPSRDAEAGDGSYTSVTLSQGSGKAPCETSETMLLPHPDPLFVVAFEDGWVRCF